jgi:LysM repeat protein
MGLQSLNGVPADLTINGAPVRLGPAATLVTLQSQSKTRLDMTVQSGSLEIADGRLVNEGQTLSVVLDNDSGGIINWADAARPATPHELTLGIIVREVIKSLSAPIIISPNPPPPPDNGNINPAPPPAITPAPDSQGSSGDSSAVVTNSGNSQVDITINGGQSVVVTTPVPQSPSQPSYKPPSSGYNYQSCRGASVNYIVQPGDTLFRIAMMYGSTIEAIAAANRIYNPNLIFAGQLLVVPCAGSYTYPGNNSYPSGYGYPYPPNSPGYPGGPMPCYSATGKSLQFSFPGIC